ncbi:Molybdenum ABC transporter, periplasmic binding protein [Sulfurimonas denitrificans DSM 1251]|uniref:Molybdenum ABC transporter, periplasmic binding protein n=1 Tax=Sulfurimonas denitrificans (strain ATCC 33889 / DSM 1251) TaxID=326298 RepID=Q30S30_SULDN|nr:molybdate ABC transporter substrate-binding protein [Sulfurimonas denitrificans]ABB44201.1 Molybdenum ABC transporter, periplasmic binding protein [Sulfurimonas denitrificans DSM 1251]
MKKVITVVALFLSLSGSLLADTINVFAASSTKLAMQKVIDKFKIANPNDEIVITFSSTGKAYAQFSNGFAYDIFMAADSTYPAKIDEDENAITKPEIYALGAVALFSTDKELIKKGLEALRDERVKHISIANPRLAPYGVAAMEIIKNYSLEDVAKSKLVLGDNIAQSVQFVDSGAAEIGLVAYSLIKSLRSTDEYMLIDKTKYSTMEQAFVLTKYAKDKPLAKKFAEFILSDESQNTFEEFGFGRVK